MMNDMMFIHFLRKASDNPEYQEQLNELIRNPYKYKDWFKSVYNLYIESILLEVLDYNIINNIKHKSN